MARGDAAGVRFGGRPRRDRRRCRRPVTAIDGHAPVSSGAGDSSAGIGHPCDRHARTVGVAAMADARRAARAGRGGPNARRRNPRRRCRRCRPSAGAMPSYAIARDCLRATTFCRCSREPLRRWRRCRLARCARCAMPMAMSSSNCRNADAAQIAHVQRELQGRGLTAIAAATATGARLRLGTRLMATAVELDPRDRLTHWWRLRTHAERAAVVAGAVARRSGARLAAGLAADPGRYRQTDARASCAARGTGAGTRPSRRHRRTRAQDASACARAARCARYCARAGRHQSQRDRPDRRRSASHHRRNFVRRLDTSCSNRCSAMQRCAWSTSLSPRASSPEWFAPSSRCGASDARLAGHRRRRDIAGSGSGDRGAGESRRSPRRGPDRRPDSHRCGDRHRVERIGRAHDPAGRRAHSDRVASRTDRYVAGRACRIARRRRRDPARDASPSNRDDFSVHDFAIALPAALGAPHRRRAGRADESPVARWCSTSQTLRDTAIGSKLAPTSSGRTPRCPRH